MRLNSRSLTFFRNFVFGVEDSLVSTVGLLSGIALASVPQQTIFLTGVVLIFVEAFSMSAGAYLSEASAEELSDQKVIQNDTSVGAGLIMFISYFVAGFIPLFPYLVFPTATALFVSIAASLGALFLLGLISGTLSKRRVLKSGLRMALVGGAAIAVGALAGMVLSQAS